MIYLVVCICRQHLEPDTKWFSSKKEALEYMKEEYSEGDNEDYGVIVELYEIPWSRTKSQFIKTANFVSGSGFWG
tara:strand:+ start:943 stop:1167 length:225 start_codon:yes stop_codon:yes gene_type:complete